MIWLFLPMGHPLRLWGIYRLFLFFFLEFFKQIQVYTIKTAALCHMGAIEKENYGNLLVGGSNMFYFPKIYGIILPID